MGKIIRVWRWNLSYVFFLIFFNVFFIMNHYQILISSWYNGKITKNHIQIKQICRKTQEYSESSYPFLKKKSLWLLVRDSPFSSRLSLLLNRGNWPISEINNQQGNLPELAIPLLHPFSSRKRGPYPRVLLGCRVWGDPGNHNHFEETKGFLFAQASLDRSWSWPRERGRSPYF